MSTVSAEGKTFFGHPRGLSTLFFTEMWERFSYYGMRAILTLYLVAPLTGENPGLGIDDGTAKAIYGTYVGLVYLTPVMGGWIADRILGLRRTVLYGGIVIAIGHYLMAIDTEPSFWAGLVAISLGTGLLKPNISGMVGQLYAEGDVRRDAGFSIFYMGINLGALVAPLVCGTLGEQYNWHYGFGAAGVGMTIGLIQYVLGAKHLRGIGETASLPATAKERAGALRVAAIVAVVLAGLMVAISLARGGFSVTTVTDSITVFILLVPIWYFRQILGRPNHTQKERNHIKAFVWVFLGAAFFWMIFEQAGSTLTLFADQVTDLTVAGGFEIPASWLQSVNPFFIVVFAPVFSAIWLRWGDRAPRTSVKFAVALVTVGCSFLLLIIPTTAYLDDGAKATVWWLITVYLLQTWAELLLSPNGLSATTKLAPAGTVGQLLALWFLATSVGTTVGGQIARITSDDPVLSFAVCGGMAVAFGVVMLAASRRINALMGGVH